MPIFGIDVSHHQGGKVAWGPIRDAGVDFMIARASLSLEPDTHFHGNITRAHDAGVPVLGAYHFLYPRKRAKPEDQADLFLDQVKVQKGKLLMLDVERDKGGVRPNIDDARAFAERFAKGSDGHPLLMYAPHWYWGVLNDPPASDLGKLVASRYVPVDMKKNDKGKFVKVKMTPERAFSKLAHGFWVAHHGGWKRATILQFTSYGLVPGVGGPVDVNAFRGTVDQLAALTRKPAPGAPLEPLPPADDSDLPTDGSPPEFHVVAPDETLIQIASRFGWMREGNAPAFRVMLRAFPENEPFRKHPGLIHEGDKVRVG
jgi:GH25 family lysozyme M1 (1,4-beta-N-acetylmuramidase)